MKITFSGTLCLNVDPISGVLSSCASFPNRLSFSLTAEASLPLKSAIAFSQEPEGPHPSNSWKGRLLLTSFLEVRGRSLQSLRRSAFFYSQGIPTPAPIFSDDHSTLWISFRMYTGMFPLVYCRDRTWCKSTPENTFGPVHSQTILL